MNEFNVNASENYAAARTKVKREFLLRRRREYSLESYLNYEYLYNSDGEWMKMEF